MELLDTGDRLPPDAIVRDHEDRPRALASLFGRDGVVLYFMRSGGCAICRAHVVELGRAKDAIERGGRTVIALVPEGGAEAALAEKQTGGVLRVLSAPDLYVALGFRKVLFGGIQQSGTALIHRTGVITRIHRASLPLNALLRDVTRGQLVT